MLGVSKPRTRAAELSQAPHGQWLFGDLPLHVARCWMHAVVAKRYHRLRMPNTVAIGNSNVKKRWVSKQRCQKRCVLKKVDLKKFDLLKCDSASRPHISYGMFFIGLSIWDSLLLISWLMVRIDSGSKAFQTSLRELRLFCHDDKQSIIPARFYVLRRAGFVHWFAAR